MKRKEPVRRSYDASNRQAAAQQTTEAIVNAAMLRLREVRPEQLTYAEIAELSGVGLRTVYRHFPTLQDLLAACLRAFLARLNRSKPLDQMSLPELAAALEETHEQLSAEPGLYRLFFVLPARSGIGMVALVERVCHDALAQIPKEHHASVCAAVELLISPYAWEVFHSQWGVPPARMTRTLLVGIHLFLQGFVAESKLLSASSPLPEIFQETGTSSSAKRKRAAR